MPTAREVKSIQILRWIALVTAGLAAPAAASTTFSRTLNLAFQLQYTGPGYTYSGQTRVDGGEATITGFTASVPMDCASATSFQCSDSYGFYESRYSPGSSTSGERLAAYKNSGMSALPALGPYNPLPGGLQSAQDSSGVLWEAGLSQGVVGGKNVYSVGYSAQAGYNVQTQTPQGTRYQIERQDFGVGETLQVLSETATKLVLGLPASLNGMAAGYGSILYDYAAGGMTNISKFASGSYNLIGLTVTDAAAYPALDAVRPTFKEAAALSSIVYGNSPQTVPTGFQAGPSTQVANGEGTMTAFIRSGQNGGKEQIVVSFQGTATIQDAIRDASFTGVYNQLLVNYLGTAANFLADVRADHPNADFTLTGHSLGGAVASILGAVAGVDAYTFNAPGTVGVISQSNRAILQSLTNVSGSLATNGSGLQEYRDYGDIVSLIGQHPADSEHTVIGRDSSVTLAVVPTACITVCHDINTLISSINTGTIVPGIEAAIGNRAVVFPVNAVQGGLAKLFNNYVDGWTTLEPPSNPSDYLRIDMLNSTVSVNGIFLTSSTGNPFDIYGLSTSGDWTLLGTASPFQPFSVNSFASYLISNFNDLRDSSTGEYAVSLNFDHPGTFAGQLSPYNMPGVPEPATWAMMLLGFGGIGFAMRRRRRVPALLSA